MIGQVKLLYTQKDLIALVRKDLINKFGQRDLAIYDLAVPEIYQAGAKIDKSLIPKPVINVKSIAELAEEQGFIKPTFYERTTEMVYTNIPGVTLSFNQEEHLVTMTGGVIMKVGSAPYFPVKLNLEFPSPYIVQEGNTVGLTVNGVPYAVTVTATEVSTNIFEHIELNARQQEHKVVINWDNNTIEEFIIQIYSPLADSSVEKIPPYPKLPEITIDEPEIDEDEFVNSTIQILVDLEFGK